MTTRTRTTAEVEAGARAIHAMDCTIWGDEMVGSWEAGDDKHIYRAEAEACLAAADAAAAPAVGVTVDWLDALKEAIVALSQAAFDHGVERGFAEYRDPGNHRLKETATKNKQARDRVFALLTAQPEPDTHGNGCPACDGKGWVEEKCLVCFGDGFDDGDEPGTRDDAGQPAEGGVTG